MEAEAFDRPADLKVWHASLARFVPAQPEHFATLRESLVVAEATLSHPELQPWIVTEDGDLLSPNLIKSFFD